MIPIFDREDYGMWKQRITMFLRYKECEIVTTRVKTETDSEDWDKKDLKAINIIYSAITNRQLKYIREENTAYEIVKKFNEMYLKESTALQIVCRRRLEKIRLDNYSDSASFFSDFEKLINELKCAGAQVSEREKLNYMLNTLPEEYSYIADIIDALKEENQTVAYVKNKIEIAEKKNKSNRGEMQSNAFSAKKEGCFRCGRVGHFARECQNGVQAGSSNSFWRGSTRGLSRGRGNKGNTSRGCDNFHRQSTTGTSEHGNSKTGTWIVSRWSREYSDRIIISHIP